MKMTVGLAYKTLQQKLEFGNPQQIEALALIQAADSLLDMELEIDCDCDQCDGTGVVTREINRSDVMNMTLEDIRLKKETT